jgi:hypothetical protein
MTTDPSQLDAADTDEVNPPGFVPDVVEFIPFTVRDNDKDADA